MNPTQVGNLIKSGLLALGVSSTVIGYVSNEVWLAIGGVVIAVGMGVWQFAALKTKALIESVADSEDVKKVVVRSPALAVSIPNIKVVKE